MSGLFAQIGYGQETTYGLPVTVDHFVPLAEDASIAQDIERLESTGIIAGARLLRSEQWSPGGIMVGGDVGHEWFQQNMGLLWRNMLGSITSSFTAGVGTHTATLGSLTGLSFTTQVGVPTVSGTVIPFTAAGCKVQSWEIGVVAGEIATLGLTLIAQTETTGIGLATASYVTGAARPFTYVQAHTMTMSGSAVCVREMTIGGENNLTDERQCIGQAYIDEPVEAGLREITGTATLEFTSTQQYFRYLAGLEVPIVMGFSASASAQATITMNARYDGQTPAVAGRDLVVVDIPIKVIGTTSDSAGFTVVLKNAQSTP